MDRTYGLIDVVILTWNDGDLLQVAVDSALGSRGVDVNVIVVDNGSDPAAVTVDDPRVHLIRNETNRGVAAARNQGVAAGRAPLVCLLDSDARLQPHTLAHLVQAAAQPDVGLAAPVFTGQQPEASAGRAPGAARKLARALNLTSTYGHVRHAPSAPSWDVDFAIGACQLFARDAFEAVNGIDETYFYGPEDVDFCLRLREAGYRVVQVARARCDHPARRRFRRILTRRGIEHAWAVGRHLWRHRAYRTAVATSHR